MRTPGRPENWDTLSWEEKRQVRFDEWLNPEGARFDSSEAEQNYKKTVQMYIDAIQLKKPDRVPVNPMMGFYVPKYAGYTTREMEYDYEKLGIAFTKFNQDFAFDAVVSCASMGCGRLFDKLDMKFFHWPGHGVPETSSYQAVEKEYMPADEYDALLTDPTGYFLSTYFPRIFGAFTPFHMLPSFPFCMEIMMVGGTFIPLGIPPVQEGLKAMMEAGQIAMEWIQAVSAIDAKNAALHGRPSTFGGFSKAPFDIIGDTLRSSRGIMLDMFRRPDKILEACDRFIPLAVQWGMRAADSNRIPFVIMPLHKGADGFMSSRDFDRFYWPSLKAVLIAYIEQGLVPVLFAEGGYNQRLDAIADPDIPAGSTWWIFDQTDMQAVKEKLGGYACVQGNVPASLIATGSPEQVTDYVKKTIEIAGKDGGFILSTGAVIDDAKSENLQAMIQAGRQYGVY